MLELSRRKFVLEFNNQNPTQIIMSKTIATTITDYNNLQSPQVQAVCDWLKLHINKVLLQSESKIWHGSPVWFIDGNPIVAYSVRKSDKVSLMFFSGQSFDEAGLTNEGKFQAAEIFYSNINEINLDDIHNWLAKSIDIQWDYKNIIKRKGILERLK